jgi:hypothetical protein
VTPGAGIAGVMTAFVLIVDLQLPKYPRLPLSNSGEVGTTASF